MSATSGLRRATILVADDSPQNIELLSRVLGSEYRIKVATSGEKALQIAYSDEPPDLILLDIMMPDLSGHEVCRRIKANPDRRRIPIIFVTAMSTIEDESLGLAIGAVDYITKPISPPLVQARVRTHLALYDQTRELERMVAQRTSELVATRQQIIRRLGRAAEYKDNETGNHVIRMSHVARLIGQQAGLGPEALQLLFQTAAMHDVGKIGIPDQILLKPGPLTDEERQVIRTHPQIGADIIGKHDNELLATARTIALTHHERWDGSGYPQGLKGEQIPMFGRIVAIADVFDALVNRRPYKEPIPVSQALAIMTEDRGKHFDPHLLDCFLQQQFEILKVMDLYSDDRGAMTDATPM
ncbi:MAG: two-component system response regulator [Burkholderiales bacterium]|nr:two-component system response regulator [Burkholderiales bacterium]MDE2076395.1 two-component system response regulator [Burkholderiales bacterium]MDE2432711.1 two-component system response regulator [Burkholderiales bacterium]